MSEYIISQNSNDICYAYTRGRFWRWDESARVWKESHLLAQTFDKAKAAEKRIRCSPPSGRPSPARMHR